MGSGEGRPVQQTQPLGWHAGGGGCHRRRAPRPDTVRPQGRHADSSGIFTFNDCFISSETHLEPTLYTKIYKGKRRAQTWTSGQMWKQLVRILRETGRNSFSYIYGLVLSMSEY